MAGISEGRLVQTPCLSRSSKTMSSWLLNIPKGGNSTASLGNLCPHGSWPPSQFFVTGSVLYRIVQLKLYLLLLDLFYSLGYYKNVSTCVNISAHFCDLSEEICEPYLSHWLRVKAVIGSQQSEYVEANEFILQRHGKLYLN